MRFGRRERGGSPALLLVVVVVLGEASLLAGSGPGPPERDMAVFLQGAHYLSVDGFVQVGAGGALSLEAWVRRSRVDGTDRIVSLGVTSEERGEQDGRLYTVPRAVVFGFHDNGLGTNAFRFGFPCVASRDFLDVRPPGFDEHEGFWHHWSATYDPVYRRRAVYLDGYRVSYDTALAAYNNTGRMTLGRKDPREEEEEPGQASESGTFHGTVEEMRVWSTVLEPRMLEYFATKVGKLVLTQHPLRKYLQAYWKFNEGAGLHVRDTSRQGHNATIHHVPPPHASKRGHYAYSSPDASDAPFAATAHGQQRHDDHSALYGLTVLDGLPAARTAPLEPWPFNAAPTEADVPHHAFYGFKYDAGNFFLGLEADASVRDAVKRWQVSDRYI